MSGETLNPYVGLRPYRESERGLFFGRDVARKIFIDMLLANRLTLLFAASGVGKSSLLQAAVLPHLKDPDEENLDAVYCNNWAGNPLKSIREAALAALTASKRITEETLAAESRNLPLPAFFTACCAFTRQPLVIVLDQFEEFFRYHLGSAKFSDYKRQLVDLITDRTIPVSIVLSMREDFALQLNAFKPEIPTVLFNNFYRLEKLPPADAALAMTRPAELAGWSYEPALLERLLKDLSTRERESRLDMPAFEAGLYVEPPYLQIICTQLFALEQQDNPARQLRLKTYLDQGSAVGLLKKYIDRITSELSYPERRLASQCFSYLITRRGTKVARTAQDLATELGVAKDRVSSILQRLEGARLLRGQSDGDETYYELYHDLFSDSVEQWNERFKARERLKKTVFRVGAFLFAAVAVYLAVDIYLNLTSHHLRLSIKDGPQGQVELYRGNTSTLDPLHLQHYLAETGITYQEIERDQRFTEKSIQNLPQLTNEWAERLPVFERLLYYREHGKINKAMSVAEGLLESADETRLRTTIGYLSKLQTKRSFDKISDALSRQDQRPLESALTFGVQTGDQYRSFKPILAESQAAKQFLTKYLFDPIDLLDLKYRHRERRAEVAVLLRCWNVSSAAQRLAGMLLTGDVPERQEAALALMNFDSAEAHQLLVKNLSLKSDQIREETIRWLVENGLDSQPAKIFPILDAAVPSLRAEFLDALAGMDDRLVGFTRYYELTSESTDAEVEARVIRLESYLDDPDEGVAAAAAGVFQFPGSANTLKKLRQRIEHSQNPEHRARMVTALRKVDPQQEGAEQKYRAYFKTKYDSNMFRWRQNVRCVTVARAWSSFNPRVLPFLLTEPVGESRISILNCIPAALLAGSGRALRQVTSSFDAEVSLVAMERLLAQDSTQAINLSSLAADSTKPTEMRSSALKALAGINMDSASRIAPQRVMAQLVRALHDLQEPKPHERAVKALIAWSREESIGDLAALLLHPDAAVRTAAVRALLALRSPRAYAVIGNAVKSGTHSRDFFDAEQNHPDFFSLYTSQLKTLLTPPNKDLSKKEREDAVKSLDSLAELGLPIEPEVISAALSSTNWTIRYHAIRTVAILGDIQWREIIAKQLPSEDVGMTIEAFVPLVRVDDLPVLRDALGRSPQAIEKASANLQQQLFSIDVAVVANQKSNLNELLFPSDNRLDTTQLRANHAAAGIKPLADALGPFGHPWDFLDFPEVKREEFTHSRPIDALETALKLKKPTQPLIRALIHEKDPRSDALLLQTLNSSDLDIIRVAAGVLAARRTLHAIQPIVQRMRKLPEEQSVTLLIPLSSLKPDLDPALLPEPWRKNRLYTPLLASLCQKSALHDMADLSYLTISQRKEALSLISGQSWRCSETVLGKFTEDPSVHVRVAATKALGSIKTPWAIRRLHSLLAETNVRVQLAAAKALAEVAGVESLAIIRAIVTDKETPLLVTNSLFKALERIGTPEAASVLFQAAASYNDSIGRQAYRALGDMRATQIVPKLQTHLRDYEVGVRMWRKYRDAQRNDAPDKITGEAKKGPQRPNAYILFELVTTLSRLADIDTASKLLGHDLAEVRAAAAMGLALRGSVTAIEKLDALRASSKDPLFQHAAFRCLDTTLEVLEKVGTEKELSALKDLRLRAHDRDGVVARLDWTIDEMEARIDGQKKATGAAEQ